MKKILLLFIFAVYCFVQCELQTIGVPVLIAPADGSILTQNPPTFIWQSVAGADLYGLQVSADEQFNTISVQTTCYMDTSYTPANPLVPGVYFWRVRAQEGG